MSHESVSLFAPLISYYEYFMMTPDKAEVVFGLNCYLEPFVKSICRAILNLYM